MKNILVSLAFILAVAAGAVRAHALLLQVPNGLYLPHPSVLIKPVSIPVKVPVIQKQEDVEAPPTDGAEIFIQSYPVRSLKG